MIRIDPADVWVSRTPTKRGGFHEPHTSVNRIGEPASAMRRHQARISDLRLLSGYLQLAPGVLVVWERKPWRILEIAERPVELWNERYEAKFAEACRGWDALPRGERPKRTTWSGRPMMLQLVPAGEPEAKPLHLACPASHLWDVLPEHYSVCVACGELPPCRHEIAERAADEQMARTEVLISIPAGHCLGCGEHISNRQKAHRFPGPNLWRPDLGNNTAVFHARAECSGPTGRYRAQWEAKGAVGSPLRLPHQTDNA